MKYINNILIDDSFIHINGPAFSNCNFAVPQGLHCTACLSYKSNMIMDPNSLNDKVS